MRLRFPLLIDLLISLVIAHSFAITLVSHSVLVISPLSRINWLISELLMAGVLWWPSQWVVRSIITPALTLLPRSERILLLMASLLLGVLTAAWWRNDFPDGLWVHAVVIAKGLGVLLFVSHAVNAATLFASLLAMTVQLCHFNAANDDISQPIKPWNGITKGSLFTFLIVLALANAFTIWFVHCERAIYYWDYSTYWNITSDWERVIHQESPTQLWDRYRHGVQSDDYGPLPATLPSLVAAILGPSRLVYLLSIVNFYFAGVAWMAWRFTLRFGSTSGIIAYVVPFFTTLLSPLVWISLVRGYLDIGGVAIGIAILLIAFSRPPGRLRWFDIFALGALLAAIVLFRRWYSYYAVAFMFVLGIDTAIAVLRSIRTEGVLKASGRIASVIGVGIWMTLLLGTFAAPWLWRILNVKYADDYIAYQNRESLLERVSVVVDNCGIVNGCIVMGSLIYLILQPKTRRIALAISAMPPLMLYLFLKVSDPCMHHCYLFLPAYLLLPSLAFMQLFHTLPRWLLQLLLFTFFAWNAVSMLAMFAPTTNPLYEQLRPAVCHFECRPLVQENLDEYIRLLRDAETAAAQSRRGKVTVVASSPIMNQTMFLTANRSLNQPLFDAGRVLIFPELDRVSPFPVAIVESDIVIVPWPPQTHLREEEQQAVVLTAQALHEGAGIGKAFTRLPGEYRLSETVVVSLYRRAKAIEQSDLEGFCAKLRLAHPNKAAFFTPPQGIYLLP